MYATSAIIQTSRWLSQQFKIIHDFFRDFFQHHTRYLEMENLLTSLRHHVCITGLEEFHELYSTCVLARVMSRSLTQRKHSRNRVGSFHINTITGSRIHEHDSRDRPLLCSPPKDWSIQSGPKIVSHYRIIN